MAHRLEIRQKRGRRLTVWLVVLVLIGLLTAAGWFGYRYFYTGQLPPLPVVKAIPVQPGVSEAPVKQDDIANYHVPASNPRYVSIPSLGVGKTRVFPVGVDKNNVLGSPTNIADAAWYDQSALPGNGYGAVLIDAHNGGYTRDGIFAKLYTIQDGADIVVERGDGKKFTYKVVSNITMSLDEVNKSGMAEMMKSAQPDKEGLSLITCAGNYVPRLGQFDKRVMVRAVRVS